LNVLEFSRLGHWLWHTGGILGNDLEMRLARLILICVVCVGVPIQGFAGVQYVDASCPLMEDAATEGADGMSAEEMHDMMAAMGCDTENDGANTGKPCPSGTSCQSIGPALLHVLPLAFPQVLVQPAPPLAVPQFQSHHSPHLWRPPAPI
jgi:hypothetical protein